MHLSSHMNFTEMLISTTTNCVHHIIRLCDPLCQIKWTWLWVELRPDKRQWTRTQSLCTVKDAVHLCSYPRTAPQTVEEQQGLGSMDENPDTRATSAPNNNTNTLAPHPDIPIIPGSPDSTSSNASSSSNLSDLDSAAELQRPGSPKTHQGTLAANAQPTPNDILPTEKVNPLTLIDEKGYNSASKPRLPEAQPASVSRPILGSGHGNRPGSDRHKVLPPIAAAQWTEL